MSITVKLITKKLGFLSSVQSMICSRSLVILVHKKFLTSQTLSSRIEKFPETRCLTSYYQNAVKSEENIPNSKSKCIWVGPNDKISRENFSGQILQDVSSDWYNCMNELSFSYTKELERSLSLRAKPCIGTSYDISVRDNYVSFGVNNQEDQCNQLKYSSSESSTEQPSKPNIGGRPSDEQLILVRETLAKSLPNIFANNNLDYQIYHPNLVFINNIRGTESRGRLSYIKQVLVLKLLGHIKFAYVKFEILKITSHPEDGTVRVRWRIRGIKGYVVFWNFVRHRKWRAQEQKEDQDLWYDGFSTYFVGTDGLIYKHIADKMMPDDNQVASKETPLAPKLAALCVGFALSAKESIFSTGQNEPREAENL